MTTKTTEKGTFSGGKKQGCKTPGCLNTSTTNIISALLQSTCWKHLNLPPRAHSGSPCVLHVYEKYIYSVLYWPGCSQHLLFFLPHRHTETALRRAGFSTENKHVFYLTQTHTQTQAVWAQAGEGRHCQCHSEWKWRCQSQMLVPLVWYMGPDHAALNYQRVIGVVYIKNGSFLPIKHTHNSVKT